jgi:hypothetical protein
MMLHSSRDYVVAAPATMITKRRSLTFMLLFLLAFVRCIPASAEKEVFGRWISDDKQTVLEFLNDGTVIANDGESSRIGDYRLIDENRFRLDFPQSGAAPVIVTFDVEDRTLVVPGPLHVRGSRFEERWSVASGSYRKAAELEISDLPALADALRKQKKAMADIRMIAGAWTAYDVDNNTYDVRRAPTGGRTEVSHGEIQLALQAYVRELQLRDPWNGDYEFSVSPDGRQYRIVALGSDGKLNPDTPRSFFDSLPAEKATECFEDDIVYQNGSYIRYPEGTQRYCG